MKIWTSEHTFKHPWSTVVQAAWRKYPNPMNPNVVGIDVVDRNIDKNTGVLKSHRLMMTQWGLPDWAIRESQKSPHQRPSARVVRSESDHSWQKAVTGTCLRPLRNFPNLIHDRPMLVGMEKQCYVSERSEVDATQKVMTLKSRNLTFSNFVTIDEELVYSQHPTDKDSTLLRQEAVIKVKGVPLTNYMESLIEGTCSGNAHKGRQALEWVINSISNEAKSMSKDFQRVSQAAANSMDDILKPNSSSL